MASVIMEVSYPFHPNKHKAISERPLEKMHQTLLGQVLLRDAPTDEANPLRRFNCLFQEESLRTYLFTYSSVYDSIRMGILADMFQLDIPMVHSIISKMIISEELRASLDQPTQTVVMHGTEPSSLQNTALQLAEKLGNLVENNERIFDHKQGSYGGYFNRDQKDSYQRKEGGGGGGYMRRGYRRDQQNQSNY
ncbi:eukaryotic translation initiation factor 3 subunit C-like [Spea bombifrons]|uniref:eukaryotic translation initiation factor 3 subunit C-like n=1 Tax=Spea bombifrons TaxID=233779 RepID=UPI00234A5C0B|nr:eukaryotic translation initiation factor 3 subunit C-like [Spea bombifrons]